MGLCGCDEFTGDVGVGSPPAAGIRLFVRTPVGTAPVLSVRGTPGGNDTVYLQALAYGAGDATIDLNVNGGNRAWDVGVDRSDGEKFKINSAGTLGGAGDRLTIDPTTGNVGIGTTSPDGRLHVWGSLKVGDLAGAGAPQALEIDPANADLYVGSASQSGDIYVRRYSDGAASARIASGGADSYLNVHGGRLGIGTASPNDPLETAGTPAAGAVAATVASSTGPVPGATTHTPGTGTKLAWRASDNGNVPQEVGYIAVVASATDGPGISNWAKDLVFAVCEGGAGLPVRERMRIDAAGRVGLGTSTPTEALEVVGNIKLSGQVISGQVASEQVTVQAQSEAITVGGIKSNDDAGYLNIVGGTGNWQGGTIRLVGNGYTYDPTKAGAVQFHLGSKDHSPRFEFWNYSDDPPRKVVASIDNDGRLRLGPDSAYAPANYEGGELVLAKGKSAGGVEEGGWTLDNLHGTFRLMADPAGGQQTPRIEVRSDGRLALLGGGLRVGNTVEPGGGEIRAATNIAAGGAVSALNVSASGNVTAGGDVTAGSRFMAGGHKIADSAGCYYA